MPVADDYQGVQQIDRRSWQNLVNRSGIKPTAMRRSRRRNSARSRGRREFEFLRSRRDRLVPS